MERFRFLPSQKEIRRNLGFGMTIFNIALLTSCGGAGGTIFDHHMSLDKVKSLPPCGDKNTIVMSSETLEYGMRVKASVNSETKEADVVDVYFTSGNGDNPHDFSLGTDGGAFTGTAYVEPGTIIYAHFALRVEENKPSCHATAQLIYDGSSR